MCLELKPQKRKKNVVVGGGGGVHGGSIHNMNRSLGTTDKNVLRLG